MYQASLIGRWNQWLNTSTLERVACASSLPCRGSRLAFRACFYPFGRVKMVWGPLPGTLMASVLRKRWSPQKSMHRLVLPFHSPRFMTLQSLAWREVGLRLSRPGVSFKPNQCDQYLCLQNSDVDFCTPLVPLHLTFDIDLVGMFQWTSEGMHRASCSPNLVES